MNTLSNSFLRGLYCAITRSVHKSNDSTQSFSCLHEWLLSSVVTEPTNWLSAGQQHISIAWLNVKGMIPTMYCSFQPPLFFTTLWDKPHILSS